MNTQISRIDLNCKISSFSFVIFVVFLTLFFSLKSEDIKAQFQATFSTSTATQTIVAPANVNTINFQGVVGNVVVNCKVEQQIGKGKAYSDDNMKKLMSELNNLIEKCSTHYLIDSKLFEYLSKILFLYDLEHRDLDSLFLYKSECLRKELNDLDSFYNEKFLLEDIIAQFHKNRGKPLLAIGYKVKKGEYNLCYFLLNLLFNFASFKAIKTIYNIQEKNYIEETFIEHFNFDFFLKNIPQENKFIHLICNLILMTVNTKNENYYYKARDIIFNYSKISNNSRMLLRNNLLTILRTYCKLKSNEGIYKYEKEIFELFKFEFGLKSYLPKQLLFNIPDSLYTIIIKSALFLDEIKWAEQFMKDYSEDLIHIKENIQNFGNAFLEFTKNNFEESLRHCSIVKASNFNFKNNIKILTLFCYYELNLFEAALSLVDSMQHYYSKSKECSEYQKNYLLESLSQL